MTARLDFAFPPELRRRARERAFHRQLACAALLGVLPVLALVWRIDRHADNLAAGNRQLMAELQSLQPQLAQASNTRQRIADMQSRIAGLDALALRRAQAARLLRASARAALPSARLYRIALHAQRAELRGHAMQTQEVQAFAEALSHAGLEGVSVQDLRIADAPSGQGHYDFTLSAPLLQSTPAAVLP